MSGSKIAMKIEESQIDWLEETQKEESQLTEKDLLEVEFTQIEASQIVEFASDFARSCGVKRKSCGDPPAVKEKDLMEVTDRQIEESQIVEVAAEGSKIGGVKRKSRGDPPEESAWAAQFHRKRSSDDLGSKVVH